MISMYLQFLVWDHFPPPNSSNKADVQKHFEQYGEIRDCYIPVVTAQWRAVGDSGHLRLRMISGICEDLMMRENCHIFYIISCVNTHIYIYTRI